MKQNRTKETWDRYQQEAEKDPFSLATKLALANYRHALARSRRKRQKS